MSTCSKYWAKAPAVARPPIPAPMTTARLPSLCEPLGLCSVNDSPRSISSAIFPLLRMQSSACNRVRAVRFGEKQAAGREDFCYFAGGPAIGCGKEPLAQADVVSASRPPRRLLPACASEGKPNALQKPLQPSKELAAVVGTSPLPRGEVVSKIWEYIRSHNLQNPENRREILADDKLTKVFGTDKVTMFEMNKHLTRHLK